MRLAQSLISNKKKLLIVTGLVIWAIVTIGLIVYLGFNFSKNHSASEADRLKQKLARHISFDGADPTVATVKDAQTLKNTAAFYRRAENGDLLVIWEEKAVLYRPSDDRIIDFGVVLAAPSPSPSPALAPSPSVSPIPKKAKVLILNGTNKSLVASQLKKQIETNTVLMGQIDSITVADAKQHDYAHSIVTDLSKVSGFTSLIADLAKMQTAELEPLPEAEKVTDTYDISILIGNEK